MLVLADQAPAAVVGEHPVGVAAHPVEHAVVVGVLELRRGDGGTRRPVVALLERDAVRRVPDPPGAVEADELRRQRLDPVQVEFGGERGQRDADEVSDHVAKEQQFAGRVGAASRVGHAPNVPQRGRPGAPSGGCPTTVSDIRPPRGRGSGHYNSAGPEERSPQTRQRSDGVEPGQLFHRTVMLGGAHSQARLHIVV